VYHTSAVYCWAVVRDFLKLTTSIVLADTHCIIVSSLYCFRTSGEMESSSR
jgi:hypothetical protein